MCRSRKRIVISAAHRYIVFLPEPAGRQRIHGKSGLYHGQGIKKDRFVRQKLCTDAHRLRLQRTGHHGIPDAEQRPGQKDDDHFDTFYVLRAKLPIYGMITAAFFTHSSALVMMSVYLLGIAVAILSGLIMKKTMFSGNPIPFVMELPAYRIPSLQSVLLHMWEKAKDFLHKAFTIILGATIIIWFLQSYDFSFHGVSDASQSMLAQIGNLLAPLFEPLGFGDWRASSALITGITAKESVVSTLSILTNASSDAGLSAALMTMFTPAAAYAFLCFTVLYMPCVAAFAATKRELGSLKQALGAVLFQTAVAYAVAFFVYQIGSVLL